jgi:hypothetical protein
VARHAEGFTRALGLVVLVMALVVGLATTGVVLANEHVTSTTQVAVSPPAASGVRERPQHGWAVASNSGRGVMVDIKMVTIGPAHFRVVRLRSRSTLLRWHVGQGDPLAYAQAPRDAAAAVDWAHEGRAGVVAVFNGGFKQAAKAGGSMADGVTFVAPVRGLMTIALDREGHWAMGVWGTNFPPAGFRPISWRQNLAPLVLGGAPTPAASGPVLSWGSPLGNVAPEPRTGLGVDRQGNLVYVATMDHVMPIQLARALVAAGALKAMELDINPYWPVLGVPTAPVHHAGSHYAIALVGAQHSPNVYDAGWLRDFFVAVAEPTSWGCHWASAGLASPARRQPQPLRLVGTCAATATATTTTGAPSS